MRPRVLGVLCQRSVVGLEVSDDEIQRLISDIARNRCFPAVPIAVEVQTEGLERVAFVEVRPSLARPHFAARCIVRIGSTNRTATDAEIIALRFSVSNPKLARLTRW